MAVDLNQLQAEDAAYAQQAAARQAQQRQQSQPVTLADLGTKDRGHITSSVIDSIVNEVGQWGTAAKRVGQDAAAGVTTAVANTADAAMSFYKSQAKGAPAGTEPEGGDPIVDVWDHHAKPAIMDFRDAVAVKDPNIVDNLAQAGAQLVGPFAAYSKALSGLQGFARVAAAGVATDVTALQPHDMRTADLIALGRQTDTKIGAVLRQLGPYGLNAYVNFLADRTNETEAEGRFKNALDGLGANLIMTPLIHAAGIVVKQGTAATRFMLENGVGSTDKLAPTSRKLQEGKIVFHGTPHNFEEFDTSKVGTGEGSQAYGHGLYFAENQGVAGDYATKLGRLEPGEVERAKRFLQDREKANPDESYGYSDPRDYVRLAKQKGFVPKTSGKLLHVDIPDDKIESMLDYDKTLDEQPEILGKIPPKDREQFESLLGDHSQEGELEDFNGNQFRQIVQRAIEEGYLIPPTDRAGNTAQETSEYLDSIGIPGIKYLDGGSRKSGSGTRNIVLFNARDAKIVKKEKPGA